MCKTIFLFFFIYYGAPHHTLHTCTHVHIIHSIHLIKKHNLNMTKNIFKTMQPTWPGRAAINPRHSPPDPGEIWGIPPRPGRSGGYLPGAPGGPPPPRIAAHFREAVSQSTGPARQSTRRLAGRAGAKRTSLYSYTYSYSYSLINASFARSHLSSKCFRSPSQTAIILSSSRSARSHLITSSRFNLSLFPITILPTITT